MSTILSDQQGIMARKKHQCCFCFEPIFVGEKYNRRSGVSDGDMWTMHMHPECNAYATKHLSHDDYEDLSERSFDRPLDERYADRSMEDTIVLILDAPCVRRYKEGECFPSGKETMAVERVNQEQEFRERSARNKAKRIIRFFEGRK